MLQHTNKCIFQCIEHTQNGQNEKDIEKGTKKTFNRTGFRCLQWIYAENFAFVGVGKGFCVKVSLWMHVWAQNSIIIFSSCVLFVFFYHSSIWIHLNRDHQLSLHTEATSLLCYCVNVVQIKSILRCLHYLNESKTDRENFRQRQRQNEIDRVGIGYVQHRHKNQIKNQIMSSVFMFIYTVCFLLFALKFCHCFFLLAQFCYRSWIVMHVDSIALLNFGFVAVSRRAISPPNRTANSHRNAAAFQNNNFQRFDAAKAYFHWIP